MGERQTFTSATQGRFCVNTFSMAKTNWIPSSDFIQIMGSLNNNCQLVMVNNGLSLISYYTELILTIPGLLVASFLLAQLLRLTCQQHPCACLAWLEPLIACRRLWASLDKHIALALHLEVQHLVAHLTGSINCVAQKQLATP